ncbi:sialic acid-binding Ig-like lectin 12 isoform X2 [Esox lucius]|uniref:sialic acid-binding Ig-like lectin 12 isoform X2 n=1 Tax=Esox lucius TaxID=8010 RepID=UPI001477698B|nr:sialic acid-binding Ig-like lectin 12 isoform X2 [Esox lucius]
MEMNLAFFILPGVLCTTWHVKYQPNKICASKGSSVIIPCTYEYPNSNSLVEVMWSRGRAHFYDGPFIYKENKAISNTSSKFEYIGKNDKNCSLKINHIEHTDSGEYAFRFLTTNNGMWTGRDGTKVTVSDTIISIMRPEENETIKEGKNVSLICENNCTSEVIWFKNNEPLPERASVIFFSDISSHDSGNYSCATKHHSSSLSDVFRISVEYEPKNTSVSVRPAPEVIRGSNVTLTCSSNANPAVDIFLWYKIDGDHCLKMGSQAKLQLNNAETAHSGHYFCVVSNKHGRQNSTVLTLKVKEKAMGMAETWLIATISALSTIFIFIALTVAWYFVGNRKKNAAPKTVPAENTADVHITRPISDFNLIYEEPSEEDVTYTTVYINTKHNRNMK